MLECVRRVKQSKAALKKAVVGLRDAPSVPPGGVWLCDNAVLLLGVLAAFESYVKKDRGTDFGQIFDLCMKTASDGIPPTADRLTAVFAPVRPDTGECAALITVLRAAYAVNAVEGYTDEETVSRCVRSVRMLDDIDEEELFGRIGETEQLLLKDPSGTYPVMSADTKQRYRLAVRRLARRKGIGEKEAAEQALNAARGAVSEEDAHIGFYLPLYRSSTPAKLYIAAEILTAALLCLLAAIRTKEPLTLLLLPIPVYSALRCLSGVVAAKLFPAQRMFSLNGEAPGIYLPDAAITVASLLPDAKDAASLYDRFAALRASDSSPGTAVVGLFDLKNSSDPFTASDKADINAMKAVFDRLNTQFGGGFVMAVRERVYAPTENEYTGHERKRGAIADLVRLLYDGENGFAVLHGDTAALKDKKYILTLDSDTELSFEVLHRLLCIACHPLNKPKYSPALRRVISGYGCIAPRTETSLASSCKTLFSTIFTAGGADAYAPAVSERYMDMFSSSLFTGKGLIDVKAYADACLNAFDDGAVLSHDIPEGALLRTGFAGDAVLTDSFPSSPASFFRRAERWIRGDVQNAPFLFRGTSRSRSAARLPGLAVCQLADNIRAAISPVLCFACLIASVFFRGASATVLLAAGVFGISAEAMISCVWSLLSGGFGSLLRTFYSSSISQSLRSLLRVWCLIGTLPMNAAISLVAAAKAVYRMTVSKRHTLQWTTASAAEKLKGKRPVCTVVIPLAAAAVLIASSPLRAAAGLVILSAVPFALSDGIRLGNRKPKLSERSREVLGAYMASMWDFFADCVTPEEHYLPPDNIQETPVRRTAHRASPTNIGLYLVSALAAADSALISADELYHRLSHTFEVLKGLMCYKGLLYNWYDTRTLLPLKPLFVSSVDCGNYEVCLSALREGLKEYARADSRFSGLVNTCTQLLERGDMTLLYNKKRGLFSIGLDVGTNRLSESYYDLFMSESVMTSYYHIANRDIPVSHWARLGRPLVRAGRYTAAVSWTGTMFEYFMPSLFLPLYDNSFRYEALKVCLREQKLFARPGQPYGVSESGYCSYDPSLSYRYRANGIRRLAQKREADCGRIYAPYATFLTLTLDPTAAIKNLSVFASLHALGRYGFYEAADFATKSGVRQDYMLVRSYMAHHVGMSMIACANALNDNIFVKRFMRDKNMMSADSLLHEKLPSGAVVSSQLFTSTEKKPETSVRASGNDLPAESGAAIYSNGEDSFVCDTHGGNRFIRASVSMFGYSRRSRGIYGAIAVNGRPAVPLAAEGELRSSCFFAESSVDGIEIRYAPALLNNHSVLALPVKLRNTTDHTADITIAFYFEPELLPVAAPSEHPAFDGMMIRSSYDKRLRALVYERSSGRTPTAALAVGFYDDSLFMYECDREKVLGRDLFRHYPLEGSLPEFTCGTDCVYPCGALRLSLRLAPGAKCEKVLLCAADETADGALSKLSSVRRTRLPDVRKAAPILLRDAPFTAAGTGGYAASVYFGADEPLHREAAAMNVLPLSALWQFGISGDLPLINVRCDTLPEEALSSFIRLHEALNVTGSANDLVFITSFGGDYRNGIPTKLAAVLKKHGSQAHVGEKGGIHVLRTPVTGEGILALLSALPGVTFPREESERTAGEKITDEVPIPSSPSGTAENCFVPNGYHIGTKAPRPWCHTLSNRSFGTLVSDRSVGYTWALNARQNKLTPWSNDPSSDLDGEKILIRHGGLLYDTAAGADVTFYDDKAVYTCVCGDLNVRLTVQTDARSMKKRIAVVLSGGVAPHTEVIWSISPRLCESERQACLLKRVSLDGYLVFTNPANTDYGGYAAYYADTQTTAADANGRYTLSLTPGREGTFCFYNLFSRSLRGIERLAALPFREPLPPRIRFTAFSPQLNAFGSALLLHNTLDTRLNARVGFYQCSGAYGFRDQLQDASSLIFIRPQEARRQILRSCAVQFPEGDVLHWYHAVPFPSPCFRGVRTHCSDDLLWLPLAVAEYVKATGDTALLRIRVRFLRGETLGRDVKERYGAYTASDIRAGVYEHCVRAIKHTFTFGAHSLPLIKGGDWNDSFSEVGTDFKGESVWLAQFLRLVCLRFLPLCDAMNDGDNKLLFLRTADKMKEAVLKYGFNGQYFIRGYYDDGSKLGDGSCDACRIDLLPQAFAVLSDCADGEKYGSALKAAFRELYDPGAKLLRLFTPPFGKDTVRAGYVNDYPPGVRENGGQYTHAAIWFALALKKAGFRDEAARLCEILCPADRYAEGNGGNTFMNEPYAMTGDICSAGDIKGRGGWSLYTGSAGWYLRLLREADGGSVIAE